MDENSFNVFVDEQQQQQSISSDSSTNKHQEQIHSSSSESSLLLSSSSNTPVSNVIDISRSAGELPAKPIRSSYPSNKDKRSFHSQWYSRFTWLEYSELTDSAYCYYCRHFSTGIILNNRVINFCLRPEINYKQYVARTKSSTNVLQVIDKSRNELVKRNREKRIKIVSTLHLCGRQMIATRGHEEGESSLNRGNFIELLRWASSTDPVALSILEDSDRNATYLSPCIQNELISLLANQIQQKISEKIKGCVFALMADESRDVSGCEQLSVVIRVIDRKVETNNDRNQYSSLFKEYFLGFVKLDQFDAETLNKEIAQLLSSLNIDLQNCIAVCFDGAAVMAGKNGGVQALLRQQYIPHAIYIHCYAHKLNLVICDVTKEVPYLSEFYSIISKIYTYFHKSSVTNEIFKLVQQRLNLEDSSSSSTTTVKKWAETRWDSRWTSIKYIIQNYKVLINSLEELADDGTERSTDARGLLLALNEPLFIVTIFIMDRLLGKIKILSDQLKSKSLDFGTAHSLISAVINQISELRNEEEFTKLYDQIIEFSDKNNIDLNNKMKERRVRKTSTRFNNCLITCTIGQREEINNKNKYRIFVFYPVIDSILIEINDRFSKTNMDILRSVSSLSPDSSKFLEIDELKALCVMLKSDIQLLNNEIQVLKPMLKQLKPKNMIDLYFEVLPFEQAFPSILSLLIGAMTIPVSSTTTERTFSKMKLIKTVARNSMSDNRLSDLSLLAIEREFCVDYEKIIDAFAIQHKNSRIMLK
ncbi:unnamed protein product [Rotaria socialis]|uniref:Zinc finger MYM-type protein 1-like n=1 Tax=Rotaria socialis TaxID=392032 RepID=A0A821C2R3_9BILA|nr:unnamed protein product [Rotaria socialis]